MPSILGVLVFTSEVGRQKEELVKSGSQFGNLYLKEKSTTKPQQTHFLVHKTSPEVDSSIFI